MRWAFDKTTSIFLYPTFAVADISTVTIGVVELGEVTPDTINERFDVTSPTLRRAATSAEITAASQAVVDATAQNDIDTDKKIRAAVLTSLRGRLGRNPTAAEIAAERAVFVAIYKNF
jgi:hypothetical protein